MHISVKTQHVLKALHIVGRSIPSKPISIVYSAMKIEATQHTLSFTTSTGEQTIVFTMHVDHINVIVHKEGILAVPAQIFVDIIKKLSHDMIQIRKDSTQAFVEATKFRLKLQTIPADQLPQYGTMIGETVSFSLKTTQLKKMIRQTTFAATQEERNEITEGVCMLGNEHTLKFFATNRQRLVLCKQIIDEPIRNPIRLVVGAKHVNELYKILPDEQYVSVNTTDTQVCFVFNNIHFYVRLLNGKYPEVETVVEQYTNKPMNTHCEFEHMQLRIAMERANILLKQDHYHQIEIHTTEDGIQLTSEYSQIGTMNEFVPSLVTQGDNICLLVNAKFVLDAVNAIEDEIVVMDIEHEQSPIVMFGKQDTNTIIIILQYHGQKRSMGEAK